MTRKRAANRGARHANESTSSRSRKSLDVELQAYQRGKSNPTKMDIGNSAPVSRRTTPKGTEAGTPPLTAGAAIESGNKEESYIQGKGQPSGHRASDQQSVEAMRKERRKRTAGRSMRSQGMERRMSGHRGVGRGQNVGTT
jgi:hypothetical protein